MNGCRPLCIPVAIVVIIDVAIVVAVALLSRPGFPCAGPQLQDYAADGGSIRLSGKGPADLPTRGKLGLHIDASFSRSRATPATHALRAEQRPRGTSVAIIRIGNSRNSRASRNSLGVEDRASIFVPSISS